MVGVTTTWQTPHKRLVDERKNIGPALPVWDVDVVVQFQVSQLQYEPQVMHDDLVDLTTLVAEGVEDLVLSWVDRFEERETNIKACKDIRVELLDYRTNIASGERRLEATFQLDTVGWQVYGLGPFFIPEDIALRRVKDIVWEWHQTNRDGCTPVIGDLVWV